MFCLISGEVNQYDKITDEWLERNIFVLFSLKGLNKYLLFRSSLLVQV